MSEISTNFFWNLELEIYLEFELELNLKGLQFLLQDMVKYLNSTNGPCGL